MTVTFVYFCISFSSFSIKLQCSLRQTQGDSRRITTRAHLGTCHQPELKPSLQARAGYQIDSRWSDAVTYSAAPWHSGIVAKYTIIGIICLLQVWKKYGIILYYKQYDTNKVVLNTDLQVTWRNNTTTVLSWIFPSLCCLQGMMLPFFRHSCHSASHLALAACRVWFECRLVGALDSGDNVIWWLRCVYCALSGRISMLQMNWTFEFSVATSACRYHIPWVEQH